jgi:hypothetical protein
MEELNQVVRYLLVLRCENNEPLQYGVDFLCNLVGAFCDAIALFDLGCLFGVYSLWIEKFFFEQFLLS